MFDWIKTAWSWLVNLGRWCLFGDPAVVHDIMRSNLATTRKREIIRRLRARRVWIAGLLGVLGMCLVIAWLHWPTSGLSRSRYLAWSDHKLFPNPHEIVPIARVFANRESLAKGSRLAREIDDVRVSFDFVGRHGRVLSTDLRQRILSAVRRGVRVRVVLADPEGETLVHHANATMRKGEHVAARIRESLSGLQSMVDEVADSPEEFRGSLEVRRHSRMLLHSMWLRDATEEDGVIHIGVYYHSGSSEWPAFRTTTHLAPDHAKGASNEFERLWQAAANSD